MPCVVGGRRGRNLQVAGEPYKAVRWGLRDHQSVCRARVVADGTDSCFAPTSTGGAARCAGGERTSVTVGRD